MVITFNSGDMIFLIKNIIKKQMKKAGFVRALEIESEKLKIQNLEVEKFRIYKKFLYA